MQIVLIVNLDCGHICMQCISYDMFHADADYFVHETAPVRDVNLTRTKNCFVTLNPHLYYHNTAKLSKFRNNEC